ncbi:Arc family DNA-binding protein [Sporomusa sphaeroides]|uniref:Arc-like DNA binding domain-containing protein n=1 Tax=Sporomusa sphaeroides DSM 2875 TaxID=1337886 RepID=A0ABM9VXN3_9FIRM|nr:Arc family DNA-binding protein [Sporomusa sphaeroides]OLS58279.1 hypothetical protein SPSPH_18150 [Sporomusa sphaeroides DSM 2875]CVK17534.1 hypothetical protein SSPH_00168 [Sporomusa sphaeroides DSM 2875]
MFSKMPRIMARLESEAMKSKLQRLARENGRTLSSEVGQIVKRYIMQYEQKYGEIKIHKD